MNEWVIDRRQSYRILVDSNLDYGQEGDLVREFLARNPDVTLDPQGPVEGRVLVSVNRLVGVAWVPANVLAAAAATDGPSRLWSSALCCLGPQIAVMARPGNRNLTGYWIETNRKDKQGLRFLIETR